MMSYQGPMNMNLMQQPEPNGFMDRNKFFDNTIMQQDGSQMDQPDSFSKIRYKQFVTHQVKNTSSYNNSNNNISNAYVPSHQGYMGMHQGPQSYGEKPYYPYQQLDNSNIRSSSNLPYSTMSQSSSNNLMNSQITNQYYSDSYGVYSRKSSNRNDGQVQVRNQIQIPEANKVVSTSMIKKTTIDDDSMSHIPSVNDRIASLCRNAKLESERLARSSLRFPRRAVTSLRYSSNNRVGSEQGGEFATGAKGASSQCQHYQGESYHCPNCLCFQENKYNIRSRSSQRPDSNKPCMMTSEQRSFSKGMSQSISLNDINCTGIQAQLSIDDLKEDLPQGWLARNHKQNEEQKINEEVRASKSERTEKVNQDCEKIRDLLQACDLSPGDFVNLIGMEDSSSKDDGSVYLNKKDMEIVIKLAKRALIVGKQDTEVAASLKRGLDIHFGRAWHVVAGLGPYGSHVASVQGALAHFRLHGWAFLIWQTPDE